jgi:hypothetical protein
MDAQSKSGKSPTPTKNPASAFLLMAGFNVVAAVGFIVFYFLHKGANGEQSYFLLIAALVSIAAAAGLIVAYNVFKRKLSGS